MLYCSPTMVASIPSVEVIDLPNLVLNKLKSLGYHLGYPGRVKVKKLTFIFLNLAAPLHHIFLNRERSASSQRSSVHSPKLLLLSTFQRKKSILKQVSLHLNFVPVFEQKVISLDSFIFRKILSHKSCSFISWP